jgi:hypothetical protein
LTTTESVNALVPLNSDHSRYSEEYIDGLLNKPNSGIYLYISYLNLALSSINDDVLPVKLNVKFISVCPVKRCTLVSFNVNPLNVKYH